MEQPLKGYDEGWGRVKGGTGFVKRVGRMISALGVWEVTRVAEERLSAKRGQREWFLNEGVCEIESRGSTTNSWKR